MYGLPKSSEQSQNVTKLPYVPVADPGGPGARAPLPPIFEAPEAQIMHFSGGSVL